MTRSTPMKKQHNLIRKGLNADIEKVTPIYIYINININI